LIRSSFNKVLKLVANNYYPADDMPKIVRGDSARVVQIFANLINNSIKFTPCKSTI